jgi:hypothetical protein
MTALNGRWRRWSREVFLRVCRFLRLDHMHANTPLYDDAAFWNDPEVNRLIKEAEAAGEITPDLGARLDDLTSKVPDAIGAGLLERLKANTAMMLADRTSLRAGFLKRLRKTWGTAFDTLRALVEAASESGAEFNDQYEATASQENDYLFDALRRLHARSCLVANEVLWMMEGGFASGAMARWRTLHELAIVAFFLREHGQETAKRYLLHINIESYKAAIQYQRYCAQLNREPLSPATIERLQNLRDDLCNRFGKAYGGDWGWAATALNAQRVTFADIEMALNIDHMRPYFKLACYSNHAGSKGLRYDLGKSLVPPDQDVLLSGPSDAGLFDPGYLTAVSLLQVTVSFLTHHVSITSLGILNALERMMEEVEESFGIAEAKLEADAKRVQAADAKKSVAKSAL